jgi:hypothetical protein
MKAKARLKPGRKPKGGRVYSVRLTDDIANRLRVVGQGSLTLGIERAAMAPKEHVKPA